MAPKILLMVCDPHNGQLAQKKHGDQLQEYLAKYEVEVHQGTEADLRRELAGIRREAIATRKQEKEDKVKFQENQKDKTWIANNWHKFVEDEDGAKMIYPWVFIKEDNGSYTYVGGFLAVQSINEREQVENLFGGCEKKE